MSTKNQYILYMDMDIASPFASDISLAIPTIHKTVPLLSTKEEQTYLSFDKGYDT
ncbi:hypothetical protein ACYSNO_06355 [Enterococcus sp. LJL98]